MTASRTVTALALRALTLREAAGRAALAAAQQEQARRAAAAQAEAATMAAEAAFLAAQPTVLALPIAAAWRAAAAHRRAAAHAAAAEAEAACAAPRAALTDTLRTRRGVERLRDTLAAEQARAAARRDPLPGLMLLREARKEESSFCEQKEAKKLYPFA